MKNALYKPMRIVVAGLVASLMFLSTSFAQSTGFISPTTGQNVNGVPNYIRAYASDNSYADFNLSTDVARYGGFDLSSLIPTGVIIVGIEVQLEGNRNSTQNLNISLSYDGTNYTTAQAMPVFSGSDELRTVGGSSDLWGRSWSISELSNANFWVRCNGTIDGDGSDILNLDQIQVQVYYARTQSFTSNGSFTPPAGVTSVIVQAWGGGGAGGGSTQNIRQGGGGGGGAYTINSTVAVTPGTNYTITVGAGGTGSTGNGGNGNTTSATFGAVTVSAAGGQGGSAATSNSNGNGGTGGMGGTHSGGTGAIGDQNGTGGGGGSSAGTGDNGTNGNLTSGGTAPTGGGNGGNGVDGNGQAGGLPGGGGGGGTENNGAGTGGAGGAGQMIITWTCPTYSIDATTVTVSPTAGNGNIATVQLTSSTLPDGTYTVSYGFSGSATDGSGTKTLAFAAGAGTFQTSAISSYISTTEIVITGLSNGISPVTCSDFSLSNNSALLPIELTSFTGKAIDKAIELQWSTATEQN
ncbi:MAG: hypothetical protein KDD02_25855, partial [Phaeodactylibacter sp.]|nr:hypothetical protein [Phaeodactylibacter sp.]